MYKKKGGNLGAYYMTDAQDAIAQTHRDTVINISVAQREKTRIGKMCRDFRITIGCSQTDVANDCNVTRGCVSKFENEGRANFEVFMWYINHGLDLSTAMAENRCVCCGDLIPEGIQVCPRCEKTLGIYESIEGLK